MVHAPLGPGRTLREWIAQCRALGRQPWLAIPAETRESFTLDSLLFPVDVAPDTDPDALKEALVADGYELFISPGELLEVLSAFDDEAEPEAPSVVRFRITGPSGDAQVHRMVAKLVPDWLPESLKPGDVVTLEVLNPTDDGL